MAWSNGSDPVEELIGRPVSTFNGHNTANKNKQVELQHVTLEEKTSDLQRFKELMSLGRVYLKF